MKLLFCLASLLQATQPAAAQPVVQPGPQEPDLVVLLDRLYGVAMLADLENPVLAVDGKARGLFRKAGPGPVRYTPLIALGLEVPIRGGFYLDKAESNQSELWSYRHKSTSEDIEAGRPLAPALAAGAAVSFDPGESPFGLYVANDQFHDAVYTQPAVVRARNPRLAAQPYKAMIYAYRDPKTRKLVPNSYLICWEYSTNDDFQDVVCLVENVTLIDAP